MKRLQCHFEGAKPGDREISSLLERRNKAYSEDNEISLRCAHRNDSIEAIRGYSGRNLIVINERIILGFMKYEISPFGRNDNDQYE